MALEGTGPGTSRGAGTRTARRSTAVTALGALAVAAVLAVVLAGRRDEFVTALQSAPVLILLAATALQLLALVVRSEAWLVCVTAAGGTVSRRRLYRASSLGNLGSQLNSQLGAAARIAVLRRTAPEEAPRIPALIASEVPILTVEAALAAVASFTLVGPLGLPWWLPLVGLSVTLLGVAGLRRLARRHRQGFWSGLAVLRSLEGRTRVIVLILVAVFAQITRNWLMLHAIGVEASLLDATAVLIAMVLLSQLPVGPSVGAAAVVVILGANGVATAAAAGVLLTVTGTAGALCFVAWAVVDLLVGPRLAARRRPAVRTALVTPAAAAPAAAARAGLVPAVTVAPAAVARTDRA